MQELKLKKNNFSICLKFIFLISSVLFFTTGCQKIFLEGLRPAKIDKSLDYKKGVLKFEDDKINLRFIITNNIIRENSTDSFIFYFHGIGRTELDWVDEKSFGKKYYNILSKNPELYELPVVSVSFGFVYLIHNDFPEPLKADLEAIFVKKVVPYFQKELGLSGKIYLIGHSMGGFNSLTLALKYPNIFSNVLAISPFVLPFSPFDDKEFENAIINLGINDPTVFSYKFWIKEAFKREEDWINYNPYFLIDRDLEKPLIFLSSAKDDYPGFHEFISFFKKKLDEKKIIYNYRISDGPHKSASAELFLGFLRSIK